VAFFLTALLGLHIGLPGSSVSPVWLPSGVALAAALLCGRRVLIGVWVAAVLAQLSVHTPPAVSAAQGLGDVLEALIAAQALLLLCGRGCRLLNVREVAVLLLCGAGMGAAVGATVGVVSLVVGAGLPLAAVWTTWFTWWLGDAAGLILITPLVIYVAGRSQSKITTRRLAEAAAFLALVGLMAYGAFWGAFSGSLATPLQYLVFVVLVVIAFRFGPRLTIVSTNLLVGVALLAAVAGRGPFILSSLNESLLHVQTSMSCLGVAGLLLAIIVNERQVAQREVEQARDGLEQIVRERTAELAELASRDDLTGLANRRAFDEALARAIAGAARGHLSTLLFGDLDGFKRCNDTHGHAFGDSILVEVADLLRGCTRQCDLVARVGGDEFGLILDGVASDAALDVAARIESRLAALSEKIAVPVSMSFGLAEIDGSCDIAALRGTVDQAMYRAKASGGAQVVRLVGEDAAGQVPADNITPEIVGGPLLGCDV
jgi:diguanylate cyclase (GGDEF)-like protein